MDDSKNTASVLLIDDEETFTRQTLEFLEPEGFSVYTENNGHEALNTINRINPDVLILDVDLGLNDTDGRVICQQVTQTERYQQGRLGIILISGQYINPADELFGYGAGADNYLTKPFKMAHLTARIHAVLRHVNRHKTAEPYRSSFLSVDFEKRTVHVSDVPIDLSKLEFDLLAYLIRADGRVCVKSELLEEVWGTMHIEEGAIAKCISILRAKLAKASPHRFIVNVHGVGYKYDSGPLNTA